MTDDFDKDESERRKQLGLFRGQMSNADILKQARLYAHQIASENGGYANSDKVGRRLQANGFASTAGPAMGSLFRTGEWEFIRYKKSARVTNHRGVIGIWKLKEVEA